MEENKCEKTYGVDALQEGVTQDIKGHVSAGLDAPVRHPVAGVGEAQIFLLYSELLLADREAHGWELVGGGVGWEDVALLLGVIFPAWDSVVDGFASGIVDESESRSRIGDGLVAVAGDGLAGHDGRGAIEHPETLGVVHGRVVWFVAAGDVFVNVAEGVEGCALVRVVGVLDRAEVDGEELGLLGDVFLADHVLDWGLDTPGSDSVDGTEGETEKPVADALLELGGEGLG